MYIDIKNKIIKKLLTNYLFKFLFYDGDHYGDTYKNGDILECQGDLFIFDDSNGNSNKLSFYWKQNGFWNHIAAKSGSIYSTDKARFLLKNDRNSQGYIGNEYYKNNIRLANQKELEFYLSLKIDYE